MKTDELDSKRMLIARTADNEIEESIEKTTKPESTRKTENLLRTVASIAIDAYGYDPESQTQTRRKISQRL